MTTRRSRARWSPCLVAVSVTVSLATLGPVSSAAGSSSPDLDVVRDATARYHQASAAEADGFIHVPAPAPAHYCISSFDGSGSMGLHLLHPDRLGDSELDPTRPEVLVYEPMKHGRRQLVAVEYIVDQAVWDEANPGVWPMVLGHRLHLVTAPNRYEVPAFYELHAWVWKHNPAGMFEDFNPRVTCEHAED